jgi:hypothetical protein
MGALTEGVLREHDVVDVLFGVGVMIIAGIILASSLREKYKTRVRKRGSSGGLREFIVAWSFPVLLIGLASFIMWNNPVPVLVVPIAGLVVIGQIFWIWVLENESRKRGDQEAKVK